MLSDRKKDLLEMHNLYGRSQCAPVVSKLRARIEAWRRRTHDSIPLPA